MSASQRRLGVRGILLRTGFVLAATCALAEVTCRSLVYAGWCSSWAVARTLRDPAHFGRYKADDQYWEMKARFTPTERLNPNESYFDPLLGWTTGPVHPLDAVHDDETCLEGRRPILLFGDSYAFGVPDVTVGTFARWTDESDLACDWRLLNYGCGGYGLDQISLLLKRAVEHQLPRRPIVIVSFLVDDDIDRCLLSLRDWPKPRFDLRDDRLVLEQEQVPTLPEYLRSRTSLSLSRCFDLLRGAYVQNHWPWGNPEEDSHKRAIARAILTDVVEFLRARDVPFFFVLFQEESALTASSSADWRESFAQSALDELQVPWVCVAPALLAHAAHTGRSVSDYYLSSAVSGGGHFNLLGNHVAFQVLREGLREFLGVGQGGDLDASLGALVDVAALPDGAEPPWLTSEAPALSASGLQAPFAVFDPLGVERAVGSWQLVGQQMELSARASILAQPPGSDLRARLVVEVDGAQRAELTVQGGEEPRDFHVDLRGAQRFRIWTELEPSDAVVARLVLDRFTVVPDLSVERLPPALR